MAWLEGNRTHGLEIDAAKAEILEYPLTVVKFT